MRSGQLAHLTGVSTDTLRHYERLGLLPLPQRTAGNYREYPPTSQITIVGFQAAEFRVADSRVGRPRSGAGRLTTRGPPTSRAATPQPAELTLAALPPAEVGSMERTWK